VFPIQKELQSRLFPVPEKVVSSSTVWLFNKRPTTTSSSKGHSKYKRKGERKEGRKEGFKSKLN
jgi:hypothetical protein